jgi:hypothetical protein
VIKVKDLRNLVNKPEQRELVVRDCVDLVNAEVKSKKGLGGVAVKAAFAVVKAIKPRILEESVDSLLDEFTAAVQPFYERFQQEGNTGTLETYLSARAPDVAEALLSITDRRADRAKNKTMVKAYHKLRPKGKVHVEQATPGIGRVLDKHIPSL